MDRPLEQAFALAGFDGPCGAAAAIEAGIRAAAPTDLERADAWISIGQCLNRIFAPQTLH